MRLFVGLIALVCAPIALAAALMLGLSGDNSQAAPPSGAIFTTTPDGSIVNENVHYELKLEVYLDGGPPPNAPQTAAGLDDGYYVFQVTDPSGKYLLSQDPARCRVVSVEDGVIQELVPPTEVPGLGATTDNWADHGGHSDEPCHVLDGDPYDRIYGPSGRHDWNYDLDHGPPAIVVQLMPFGTTPNPGGVYKAWVTPLVDYRGKGGDLDGVPRSIHGKRSQPCPDFCAMADQGFGPPRSDVKTDNFKVKEFYPPEITVRKFHDENGNGIWNPGEPEIGVDQCVDRVTGDIIPCPGGWPYRFTEPVDGGVLDSGHYTPGVHLAAVPGTYEACEEMLPDWGQTAAFLDGEPLGIASCVSVDVAGASGETHEIIFGDTRLVRIEGEKFIDYDADGVRDAEDRCPSATEDPVNHPGCAGVVVYLDGTDNLGRDVHRETSTGDDGRYEFTDLYPGSYAITVGEPGGFYCSFPGRDADCNYDRDALSGDVIEDIDFGDFSLADVYGVKFFDRNGNGSQDAGEEGIPDVEIHLEGTDGAGTDVHLMTWTCGGTHVPDCLGEPAGTYWFLDLVPGEYEITEVVPEGFTQIAPDGDYDHDVTLVSDEVCTERDFANFGPCHGLTPGYWSNWRNHYTDSQFLLLLEGTIAEGDMAAADGYLSSIGCDGDDALHCMRRFLLADQLTLNLTQHPELPNPDDAGLVGLCRIDGIAPVQAAIDDALAILANPAGFTREDILSAKNLLAAYAELNGASGQGEQSTSSPTPQPALAETEAAGSGDPGAPDANDDDPMILPEDPGDATGVVDDGGDLAAPDAREGDFTTLPEEPEPATDGVDAGGDPVPSDSGDSAPAAAPEIAPSATADASNGDPQGDPEEATLDSAADGLDSQE